MSIQNGTSLTKEALQYLAGLIRDISGLDSKLIDDINLKTNGTYSSVRIKSLIDKNLEEANKHTEDLISALNKLSSKKTNIQPTLDNSEFNVIYLYSTDGNAPFEQYLKIGTNDSDAELISLGSTNISLDEYLTVLEASQTYAKQVDLNTTNNILTTHINNSDIHITSAERTKWNEVDNKVNKTDIIDNLTSTDTDKPLSANQGKVLKDEVDLKANNSEVVKKTDITTTIDSTSTDSELPTAKSIYDLHKSSRVINIPTWKRNVTITFTNSSGASAIILPNRGMCIAIHTASGKAVTSSTIENTYSTGHNFTWGLDENNGLKITINSGDGNMVGTIIINNDSNATIEYGMDNNPQPNKIENPNYNVSKKLITISDETNYKNSSGSESFYVVRNGICYVTLAIDCVSPLSNTQIATLPKAYGGIFRFSMGKGNTAMDGYVLQDGLLKLSGGTSGTKYYAGSFSYPVSES